MRRLSDYLERYFNLLKCTGPACRDCPELTKIIIIVYPKNQSIGNILLISWVKGVHGRTLYWQLYWGRQIQSWLAQKAEREMGEKNSCDRQNGREIYSVNLCRCGPCNPIRMDLFLNAWQKIRDRHLRDWKRFCGKKIAFFGGKTENPLSSCRISKYVVGKEIQDGNS